VNAPRICVTQDTVKLNGKCSNKKEVEDLLCPLEAEENSFIQGAWAAAGRWSTRNDRARQEMDMDNHVAIVTGGLRGLGRAMTFGLARTGVGVLAMGHIESDVAEMQALLANAGHA
jgi:hypothetical protein